MFQKRVYYIKLVHIIKYKQLEEMVSMLKVNQVVKGFINCGIKNPFYNKPVLLKVKTVINDELVEVETVLVIDFAPSSRSLRI